MLSLQGSIQFDPFSPEHLPVERIAPPIALGTSEDESMLDHPTDALRVADQDDDDIDDDDAFPQDGKTAKAAGFRKRRVQATDGAGKKKRKTADEKKVKDKSKKRKKT